MEIEQKLYLGLGANLGDCKSTFANAIKKINLELGPVTRVSKLYTSKALNPPENPDMDQPNYFNMALICKCKLTPEDVIIKIKGIEKSLGLNPEKKIHWGPREVDIDILAYGKYEISLPDLQIPHPELINRDFVLYPLMDIDSNFTHPISKKKIIELIQDFNHSGKPQLIIDESDFS